jgi:hypothetical protein
MSLQRVATDLVWLNLYTVYFTASRLESFKMLSQFYLSQRAKDCVSIYIKSKFCADSVIGRSVPIGKVVTEMVN